MDYFLKNGDCITYSSVGATGFNIEIKDKSMDNLISEEQRIRQRSDELLGIKAGDIIEMNELLERARNKLIELDDKNKALEKENKILKKVSPSFRFADANLFYNNISSISFYSNYNLYNHNLGKKEAWKCYIHIELVIPDNNFYFQEIFAKEQFEEAITRFKTLYNAWKEYLKANKEEE